MRLSLISAPGESPVSLSAVKAHARVDSADEDALLQALIEAATSLLDGPAGILGRAIVTQTWLLELPAWPASLVLPIEPVQSVTISYLDADGAEVALDPGLFYLSSRPSHASILYWSPGWVEPALSQANAFPVRVRIVAGFGAASATPPAIAQAIKMMVTHWYQQREAVVVGTITANVPLAVDALLAPFRRML